MEKFESCDAIERRVAALSLTDARDILAAIVEVLYGPEAGDDWNADELEAIASLLHADQLTP